MLFAAILLAAVTSQGVPPGVARISVVQSGTVILTRSGKTKTQVVGTVNMPVFAGDYVATTDPDTLAELQLDGYTALRLSGGVQARVVTNDAKTREVDLAQGLVELAVLHADDGVTEVVAPNVVVRALHQGDYRIWAGTNGETSVTARRGEVDLVTGTGTFTVQSGKTILVRGDSDHPSMESIEKVDGDAFDDFNHQRDRAMYAALNENTNVPSSVASYDDLDQYGHWADVAPYGESWIPNQTPDWAPYRDGTWVWGASYGWTWVGNEPWGWLPYHYGSWFFAPGYGWCWYPPSFGIVPVWVPAFVAFFGYGPSYGYPYYGWVPLAPYESFYPWYPWYWGWYYPWRQWHPPLPTPPPPPHRHHGPIRMNPLESAYRNALFGGASTFDSRALHGGLKATPIRFDPVRFKDITVRHDPAPVALPVERPPAQGEHHVTLSQRFEQPRYASHASLPQLPQAVEPSSHYYYSAPVHAPSTPQGPQSHAPVETLPVGHPVSAPVERAPSAPSEPVVRGGDAHPADRGDGDHGTSRPPP